VLSIIAAPISWHCAKRCELALGAVNSASEFERAPVRCARRRRVPTAIARVANAYAAP